MGAGVYYIYANPHKPEAVLAAKRLVSLLVAKGEKVYLDDWLFSLLQMGVRCRLPDIPQDITAIISLGGDGTLLRVLPVAALLRAPVLGVNMGRVGFLLETDKDELDAAVERLINRDFVVEERMMLRCRAGSNPEMLVVNDVALTRGSHPGSIEVRVMAGDELVFDCHGDGVLISTPTGTTGYALSAGGPVVFPTLESMLVVPICSHVVSQRPIVLPAGFVIRLIASAPAGISYQVIMDGQVTLPLTGDFSIELKIAEEKARFIRYKEQGFFSRLRQKQALWSSEREESP